MGYGFTTPRPQQKKINIQFIHNKLKIHENV
jgi:hypothetical protein